MSLSASSANSSADERVLDVQFSDDAISVSLRDGRVITAPLVWYPRLLDATGAQRKNLRSRGPLLEKREKWGTPSGYGADDKLPGPDVGHPACQF